MIIAILVISSLFIFLILWWFFAPHPASTSSAVEIDHLQQAEIVVDGGYTPEILKLKAGVPAKLTFIRKTNSSCLAEVLLPDFKQQVELPVGIPVTIQLPATKPGVYTYSCGMRMFFGKIEVVA